MLGKQVILIFLCVLLFEKQVRAEDKVVIRVGHFPNITHAQAVIGHGLTRQQKGWFEERLGPNVEVQWYIYNAGPSAMEGVFTQTIDLTYVGPSPTINAYTRAKGEYVRVVCGSCSGGAALLVQPDEGIEKLEDFKGKKVGTPQLGNTQDVAARAWFKSNGFKVTLTGGDVLIIPTQNPDQVPLFQSKQLDAVWTVEPWVSRLVLEAQAKVYFNESELWPQTKGQYVTTHLVARKNFLDKHSEIVKKWIKAHIELTDWIKQHNEQAKSILNEELKNEVTKGLPKNVLDRAWNHLNLTYDPIKESLFQYATFAYDIGFIKTKPDLSHLYDLALLNEVLKEKKLPEVKP